MFSVSLISAITESRKRMTPYTPHSRPALVANLVFVCHLIRASEMLINVAAGRAPDYELQDFYDKKINEEKDHYRWMVRDLTKAADVDLTRFNAQAAAMAGSQYYQLFHGDPASLLGYMAALECFPTPLEHITTLEILHGRDLLRTARYHAEHDIHHGKELLEFIDTRPASEHSAIMWAALQATQFLVGASHYFSEVARCDTLPAVAG